MLVLDFKFKYFLYHITYYLIFCRKWITVEPVSNQDEFGHGLRISKGGKPKRSIQASADNTGEISVSKPPLPRFVLFGIIYIYKKKKKLKKENEETKKNATELAFQYESKFESICLPFSLLLPFKLTSLSLFLFFRKMKEIDGTSLHRSLYSF